MPGLADMAGSRRVVEALFRAAPLHSCKQEPAVLRCREKFQAEAGVRGVATSNTIMLMRSYSR
jgi:hypothetical protein